MELKKEKYFAIVSLIREYRKEIDDMSNEWRFKIYHKGSQMDVQRHLSRERMLMGEVVNMTEELEIMRKDISRETLREWSDEYDKIT